MLIFFRPELPRPLLVEQQKHNLEIQERLKENKWQFSPGKGEGMGKKFKITLP